MSFKLLVGNQPCFLIVAAVSLLLLVQFSLCQQIPTFTVGTFFPSPLSLSALQSEEATCRAITDRIRRNSARFNSVLVTNNNDRINFSIADARIMSSRMQSRLESLANSYFSATNKVMTIHKAWTPFPDPELTEALESLHYEGRTVRVQLPAGSNYDQFLRMAVTAAFDWVYYESANYVRLSAIPSTCKRNVDAVFMLDRSASVGPENHITALEFIKTVVSFFDIGRDASRIGLVAFSTTATIEFDLDDHTSLSSIQNAIDRVLYFGGSTNTGGALDNAHFLLNPMNNRGARLSSEGIPKIAILITDGMSNSGELQTSAPALRNAGVQVYAVGIGDINREELRFIASDPDDQHVFVLQTYLDTAGFVNVLSVTACDALAILQPGDNTIIIIRDGGTTYFQTSSVFSSDVLVELTDITGTTFLYVSGTQTNPGPLTSDTVANTTTGITRRTVTFTLPGNSTVVYIGSQGQTIFDRFTIMVWDLLFDPVDAFIDVVEGALAGVTIYEVQANLTAPASVNNYTYSIINGNENGIFSIDSSNGRVFIPVSGSSGINFDVQRMHNLTVQAQNNAQLDQRGRIRINIRVISNRITFNSIPTLQVMEDASITTSVVQVVATGGLGNIEFSIVNGNSAGDFNIDANTGIISVNQTLDFETTPMYILVVRAESVGSTATGEDEISISIQDINEPPVFISCTMSTDGCTYNIDENVPATLLGQIIVDDPDSSSIPNGMLSYSSNMHGLPFAVDPSGNLRTTAPLDREVQSSYMFTIIVTDECPGCALSISTDILVTVNDLNDNSPVFILPPSTVQISEDSQQGITLAVYKATDVDVGDNAVITYALSPANFPFKLSSTGTLSLAGEIDFESTQSYAVTITVSNNGTNLSSSVVTTVQILNINDNSPVFTRQPYRATVIENSDINTLILNITATDADLDSKIQYSIISGNCQNYFALNSTSGFLTVNGNIDRESTPFISLLVEASDGGIPQTRTNTTIDITISDMNDNQPIFKPDTYIVQLHEGLLVGQKVIQLIATDADEPNTTNSNIIYSIRSGNSAGRFKILSSGQIQINASLDFKTTSFYALVVEGRDEGDPVLSATASVTITVTNDNGSLPTQSVNQTLDVSESMTVNSTIIIFQVVNQDQMAITFSILSGNDEGKFAIEEKTGMITLVASLDYETTTSYTLAIEASYGQQSAEAALYVTVRDVNEFSPVFSGPFDFTVKEEERPGILVGTVLASDGDRAAVVTYEFVSLDKTTENFNLDPSTGVITTIRVLNRENMTQIFNPPLSQVTVQISAMDDGSPIMRTIRDYTITLEDINDNAPTFSDTSYSNLLMENLPSGQAIFTVAATDADIGLNGQVSFSFILTNNQSSSNPFRINSTTGAIITAEPLDYEMQPFYLFAITARDGGSPSLSTTVSGNLSLIDVNDNAPRFSLNTYHIIIPENFPEGGFVMTFFASDEDKGINAEVEYFLEDGEIAFKIGTISGELSTSKSFDFEMSPQINVSIFANDRGLPQRTGTTTLVIDIMNIDEAPPTFVAMSCDTTVSEDVNIGTIVISCTAIDHDTIATENQQPVTYSLINPFFEVNSTNGDIITKALLDRETDEVIITTITVTDLEGRNISRDVVIRITDANDNSPQFLDAPYSYHFTDSAIQTYTQGFLTLQVTDLDLGSTNGNITLKVGRTIKLTDKETTVEVIAQDNGSPQMTNSTYVTITFQSPCQLQTYSITPGEVYLTAQLICIVEVTPTPSLAAVFGRSASLTCRIVTNSRTEYQWLHNGTTLTNTELVDQGRTEVSLTLSEIQFNQAGEYACIASSQAGSLQSTAIRVIIQVSPTIISPPQHMVVREGSTISFTCSATGIPPPIIQWFVGTQRVGEGSVFTIIDVDSSRAGNYTCGASNTAGDAAAAAILVVFDLLNVFQLKFMVNQPSHDGDCHYFNPSKLEATIYSVINLRVRVTNVSGSSLCEINPCSPSPCNNGGTCSLRNMTEGYECTCTQGYSGVNCSLDINECDLGECGVDGECSNTRGSFLCNCEQNITGRRCQFEEKCSNNPCSGQDQICLEDSSTQGYQCQVSNSSTSLTVGGALVTMGQLNDLIQAFINRELEAASTTPMTTESTATGTPTPTSNRLTTQCEPRFSPFSDGSILLWVCPLDEPQPSPEQQQMLCTYLLALPNVVTQCKPPLGETMTQPTIPPLPNANLTIDLVFVDEFNQLIDADNSREILEEKLTQAQPSTNSSILATTEMKERALSTAAIIWIVVGVFLALLLICLVRVCLLCILLKCCKKKKEEDLEMVPLSPRSGGAASAAGIMADPLEVSFFYTSDDIQQMITPVVTNLDNEEIPISTDGY